MTPGIAIFLAGVTVGHTLTAIAFASIRRNIR